MIALCGRPKQEQLEAASWCESANLARVRLFAQSIRRYSMLDRCNKDRRCVLFQDPPSLESWCPVNAVLSIANGWFPGQAQYLGEKRVLEYRSGQCGRLQVPVMGAVECGVGQHGRVS